MPDEVFDRSTIQVVLGSGAAIFVIATVFWAGATYNRISGIESRLVGIEAQLSRIGDINVVEERVGEQAKRIEQLESTIRQLK